MLLAAARSQKPVWKLQNVEIYKQSDFEMSSTSQISKVPIKSIPKPAVVLKVFIGVYMT